MLKIWPQVKVMTWSEKFMLHTNRSVSSSSTHLRCFHRFSLPLSKVIAEKTAGDLSWPEMTLETWWRVTGRNIRIQGVKPPCKPMFESVSNVFCPKEAPFNFLPFTYNGEVAKLIWPSVTDIIISRWTFYRYCSGCQMLQVLRWSVIRCSCMTSIQTFSEVRSLDVTWWPGLEWPGSEIVTICVEKMYEQVCQKRRRRAPPFFEISAKLLRGCSNTPWPARSYPIRFFAALQLFWFPSYVPICRKMLNSTKFDLWWPLNELTKNDWSSFFMIFDALSNAAYRVSLHSLGAE